MEHFCCSAAHSSLCCCSCWPPASSTGPALQLLNDTTGQHSTMNYELLPQPHIIMQIKYNTTKIKYKATEP